LWKPIQIAFRQAGSMTYRMKVIPKRKRRAMRAATEMKARRGLPLIESPLACPLIEDHVFSDLPSPILAELDMISCPASYTKDAILFVEGQEPRGVFVLCNGRVKLSTNSADGRSIIVRIAEPGEVVGLVGVLSGRVYELTAEALEPLQANFIPREAFLRFLRENGEAAVRVAEIVSGIYHATLLEVRYLGFSSSTAEKLARFLLDLPATPVPGDGQLRAALTMTHKEIGGIIGASRETVTRLFANFKRQGLMEIHESNAIFLNKASLEKLLDQ
jgi:CRP/FNR family transcriptional regulator, cyclic AMP receptor protein